MSNRPKAVALAVAAAVLCVALVAGCSSSGKSTPTTVPEKGFEIATPDGTASLSLSGDLPPGWPSEFPVPDGADVAGSGTLSNSTSTGLVALFTVSGDPSDTYDFYKSNTAYTVTSSSSAGVGRAYVGTVQFTGSVNGSVTLAGRNSKSYLAIVLKTATDATTTTGIEGTTTTVATASTLAAG
jgi:hypothetical protein